jgi:hypothetical protein
MQVYNAIGIASHQFLYPGRSRQIKNKKVKRGEMSVS